MIVCIGGRLKLVAVEEDDRPPLPPHASPITVYDYKVSGMMKNENFCEILRIFVTSRISLYGIFVIFRGNKLI